MLSTQVSIFHNFTCWNNVTCAVSFAGVMKKLEEYYSKFVADGNIYTEFSIPAEHAMVSLHCGHMISHDGHRTVT